MTDRQNRQREARLRRVRSGETALSVDALERELRRTRRASRGRRDRHDRLAAMVVALALAAVVSARLVSFVRLRGSGMRPTLEAGSVVACLREGTPLAPKDVRRGELVLVDHQGNLVIRRVVALGGDAVDIAGDGTLYVNDAPRQEGAAGGDAVYPVTVPEGEMFLLGDCLDLAIDSRSRGFGPVPVEAVVGRPRAVLWPAYLAAWLGEGEAG